MHRHLQDVWTTNGTIANRGIAFIDDFDLETVVSYQELYERSLRVLRQLREFGVKPGQELLFQIDDSRTFVEWFWACVMGRIIAVPVTVGSNEETWRKVCAVWKQLNDPFWAGNEAVLRKMKAYVESEPEYMSEAGRMMERFIDVNRLSDKLEADLTNAEDIPIDPAEPDQIAFVQFSSGSTGDPKGVILTHRNVIANVEALRKWWKLDEHIRALSWMPLTHDMGLIAMHIMHTFTGAQQYIMRTKLFVQNPIYWIELADKHRVHVLYAPNFAFKYFLEFHDAMHDYGWDLSEVKYICNGAEPISVDLCERFLQQLAGYGLRKQAMKPAYGLAEGTVGVSFTPADETYREVSLDRKHLQIGEPVRPMAHVEKGSVRFADVGSAIESCRFRITDESGQPLPDGTIGQIRIQGESVSAGYYNHPQGTRQAYDESGWLYTGDIGFARGERLVVIGREKDVLYVNGQNVYAHDIERVAEEVEGVRAWNVAACGVADPNGMTEQTLLFVLHRKKELDSFCQLADKVRQHIQTKMDLYIDLIIPVDVIPKTTSGKLQRYKLGEAYKNGEYDQVLGEMERIMRDWDEADTTEQKLLRACTHILGKSLHKDEPFHEAGGSSLVLVKMADHLWRRYDFRVTVADLYKHPTVASLQAYIDRGERPVLQSVSLPAEYYLPGERLSDVYSTVLDRSMCLRLQQLAEEAGASDRDLLLGLFLYWLYQCSEESSVSVYVEETGQPVRQLDVELGTADTIEDLLTLIQQARKSVSYQEQAIYSHELERLKPPGSSDRSACRVRFADEDDGESHVDTVFDLEIVYANVDDGIEVRCEFAPRLNSQQIEQGFAEYVSLIEDVVEYDDEVGKQAAYPS